MKYEEIKSIPVAEALEQMEAQKTVTDESADNDLNMETLSGDSAVDKLAVDKLQATVYKAGVRLVPVLEKADEDAVDPESLKKVNPLSAVNTALKELGHFAYDVGFAGEQSCGKSTVVNSLLQYPLMPTCKAPTTASVVQIVYSEHFRVRAIDDDTQKIVLDFDCEMPKDPTARKKFREQFEKLLDYAISAMGVLIIENFQYFTDVKVVDKRITVKDVEMTPEDPKHVMLLLFILLAVYVGQNDAEWNEEKRQLMAKRKSIFSYLGIPKDTINISVKSQGRFELLKSGLIITDLPGLGSNATHLERNDGRKVKGHDEITTEAIQRTDSMVFLTTPANREAGYKVLPEMLSSAKLKETIYKGERIIPVLNKADTCGEQEKRTTIQAICDALKAANVEKKPEDIRKYSGIWGEYTFKGIPFERTLFFKENYDEESMRRKAERKHTEYEAIKEEEIVDLKEKMEKKYADSGIEEMLRFFRTSYVEVGKFNKSTAALQAIRAMVMSIVSELSSTVKICQTRLVNKTNIQDNLAKDLKIAVEMPLANSVTHQEETLGRIRHDFNDTIRERPEAIFELYKKAFEKALENYKSKLLATLGKFKCGLLPLSDKARIDVAGSENRRLYNALLDEINDLPISLIEVNRQYEKILKSVRVSIDRFYSDSLRGLKNLKDDIRYSLDRSIASANNSTSEEIKLLEAVKDQLLVLVDKQIEVVSLNLAQQQQEETDAMDSILSAILNLNTEMTGTYAAAIRSELYDKQSNGFLFSSREYLQIDGADGMKAAINNLQLSEKDKQNLSMNLDANVNKLLLLTIPKWFNNLELIVLANKTLKTRLEKPIQEIIDVMTGKVEKSGLKLEAAKKKILNWYGTCDRFNEEVRPSLKAARIYMKDKEDSNLWLQKDIFYDCFDKETEDEYERIRKAQ